MYILNKAYKIALKTRELCFKRLRLKKVWRNILDKIPNQCVPKLKKAIELFATFKPESALHPSWGLDRAQES